MAYQSLYTFLSCLEVFRSTFTSPSFKLLLVILSGWILTNDVHAVTQALVVTGVAGQRHHEAYHRFFSRGTWKPDELGKVLFEALLQLIPTEYIFLALDDTHAEKKGSHIFGLGSHLDPVRSTKKHKAFCFGHCWVVLAILIKVPFSHRTFALPILFRLYRSKQECLDKNEPYLTKNELAREMLTIVIGWVDGRRAIEVTADSAYCNATVLKGLIPNVVFYGSMRPDAVLTDKPVLVVNKKGRPKKRGNLLPKPEALAKDAHHPWKTVKANVYGAYKLIEYKTFCGQWYRAAGTTMLRIVIVRVTQGSLPFRVFFCTDVNRSVVQVLEGYAQRWSIEVTFRELKQLLGFADSSARKKNAVERTSPLIGLTYTFLVYWFTQANIYSLVIATPPCRPWYLHKKGLCFADILRAAHRTLIHLDVLDPQCSLDNLRSSHADVPPRKNTQSFPTLIVRRQAA
jgi:hypothetical protein